jgi:hypothetical protein
MSHVRGKRPKNAQICPLPYQNPFFMAPEECLQELHTRRAADETPQQGVSHF